jgi:hypothetical protein
MEKRDYIVIFVALIIVLVMAVFVKPMLTGQQVVFLPSSPPPSEVTPVTQDLIPPNYTATPEPTQQPDITPAPVSSGEKSTGTSPISNVTPNVTPMSYQPDPSNPMPAVKLINYAEIIGKYTGQTNPFRIPTPYWELHYNVTPADENAVFVVNILELTNKGKKPIRSLIWQQNVTPDPQDLRFFEGGRDYYLDITADKLKEYKIDIKIPLKYISDV